MVIYLSLAPVNQRPHPVDERAASVTKAAF